MLTLIKKYWQLAYVVCVVLFAAAAVGAAITREASPEYLSLERFEAWAAADAEYKRSMAEHAEAIAVLCKPAPPPAKKATRK